MRILLCLTGLVLISCQPTLSRHGRIRDYAETSFFDNHASARPWPEGVVPRNPKMELEPPLTSESLHRGQEQYQIYCQVCHGLDGRGNGMAVQRGFPKPPSLHDDRLLKSPTRHFYDVPTQGFGRMFSYASRISSEDRWFIAQYIRALQLQQHFPRSQLTNQDLKSGAQQ